MDAECCGVRVATRGSVRAWLVLAAWLAVVAGGCVGGTRGTGGGSGRAVTIGEFAASAVASENAGTPTSAPVVVPARVEVVSQAAARDGLEDLVATPGAPASVRADGITAVDGRAVAAPRGGVVFVDAKVGDVNGRAVYASAILDYGMAGISPIGAQLAAEAKMRPAESWRGWARIRIAETLADLIREELLRAEALQSLTPEQKMGFLGFMQKIQGDFVRQRGGSQALAERSLQETEGITIDEWRRRQENDELVKFQVRERILGRVNVNYRDIEQRYEREKARFDPPPTAVFRLVQVPRSRPEDVAAFAALLGSGTGFAEAAKSPLNINQRERSGAEMRELKGPRAEGDFFPNATLNDAARTMKVGETVGPLELSASVAWLHLEAEEDRDVGIYDAQLLLEDEIRGQRTRRERDRYIMSLQSRASITDATAMVERLTKIAEARYFAPVR